MVNTPAGFGKRLGAVLIDGLILTVPMYLIGLYGADPWKQPVSSNYLAALMELLYFFIVPVLWNGYTIGKKMWGIRIVRTEGGKISTGTMLLRYFIGGLFYTATLGLGIFVSIVMIAAREDKRAVHDLIAGTSVVAEPAFIRTSRGL